MATIARFEDIEAWKKARELTGEVYRLTGRGSRVGDSRYVLQIRSACVSIMSNIAEGFERDGNAEFKQFLHIAKASAGEVRSLLYIAHDCRFFPLEVCQKLSGLVLDVSRLTAGLIRYLQQTEMKGRKFDPN